MLKGITEKGEMKNIRVSEDGEVLTKEVGTQSSNIGNTEDNPIPVKVISGVDIPSEIGINNNIENPIPIKEIKDIETTLQAGLITVGTEAITTSINQKVTDISIANYSETADISMTIGEKTYQIGANLAVDLPINAVVSDISLISTEADTKIQLVVKGVEQYGN